MPRKPKRLNPAQIDWIYSLCKTGMSSAQVASACGEGDEFNRPFRVSASHVRTVFRRERLKRGELYRPEVSHEPASVALPALLGRLVETAEREVERLELRQEQGRLNAKQMAELTTALERIHRLDKRLSEAPATPPPPLGDDDQDQGETVPPTFAERLLKGEAPDLDEQGEHTEDAPAFADVVVSEEGRAPGRPPADLNAVPSTPTPPSHEGEQGAEHPGGVVGVG